jgi:hypothetical protein
MPATAITHNGKHLTLHKAVSSPHFNEKTVLVTSTWDYVDLWLKRARKHDARFYWSQARSFYEATQNLPKTSAPLTAYYCFLNATKAFLLTRGQQFGDQHGVSGYALAGPSALSNEKVKFKNGGILPALCQLLGEQVNQDIYSLKDVLYNLPYIHRAYNLTIPSDPELFIPLSNPTIVKSDRTHEAWFSAQLIGKYATQHTINKLPNGFERDMGYPNEYVIRCMRRFDWRPRAKSASLARYKTYHHRLRQEVLYINSSSTRWYLKRGNMDNRLIARSALPLAFAAMHRLSELSRYSPDKLAKHFECQHNWLLSEFISAAPNQFIDSISSEITGHEFALPERI